MNEGCDVRYGRGGGGAYLLKVSERVHQPVRIGSPRGALEVAGSVSPLFASKLTYTVFN